MCIRGCRIGTKRNFAAGEYNLRLGILKELHPEIIATHQGTTFTKIAIVYQFTLFAYQHGLASYT